MWTLIQTTRISKHPHGLNHGIGFLRSIVIVNNHGEYDNVFQHFHFTVIVAFTNFKVIDVLRKHILAGCVGKKAYKQNQSIEAY